MKHILDITDFTLGNVEHIIASSSKEPKRLILIVTINEHRDSLVHYKVTFKHEEVFMTTSIESAIEKYNEL